MRRRQIKRTKKFHNFFSNLQKITERKMFFVRFTHKHMQMCGKDDMRWREKNIEKMYIYFKM